MLPRTKATLLFFVERRLTDMYGFEGELWTDGKRILVDGEKVKAVFDFERFDQNKDDLSAYCGLCPMVEMITILAQEIGLAIGLIEDAKCKCGIVLWAKKGEEPVCGGCKEKLEKADSMPGGHAMYPREVFQREVERVQGAQEDVEHLRSEDKLQEAAMAEEANEVYLKERLSKAGLLKGFGGEEAVWMAERFTQLLHELLPAQKRDERMRINGAFLLNLQRKVGRTKIGVSQTHITVDDKPFLTIDKYIEHMEEQWPMAVDGRPEWIAIWAKLINEAHDGNAR